MELYITSGGGGNCNRGEGVCVTGLVSGKTPGGVFFLKNKTPGGKNERGVFFHTLHRFSIKN